MHRENIRMDGDYFDFGNFQFLKVSGGFMTVQTMNKVLRELGSLTALYERWNTHIEGLAKLRGINLVPPDQVRILRWAQDRPLKNCELLKRTGWLPPRASQNTKPLL